MGIHLLSLMKYSLNRDIGYLFTRTVPEAVQA